MLACRPSIPPCSESMMQAPIRYMQIYLFVHVDRNACSPSQDAFHFVKRLLEAACNLCQHGLVQLQQLLGC
jgi:hypothetical protein